MTNLDYAVIGNCAVASLISCSARHEWFCFPRLDAEPVFNSLLGGVEPDRGYMDVVLRDQTGCRQSYLRNTAVVETLLTDRGGGCVRVLDLAPRFRRFGRMYRPPTLIRRIEPVSGRPRIRIRVRPSFGYGADTGRRSSGSNHIRYVGDNAVLRLTTDAPLTYIAHEAEFALDRPVSLVLGADESLPENPDAVAREALANTEEYWRDWVRGLNLPFDWQEAVIRAAITLKICSFEDTGGIVAALTTSVPEAPGSGRCWDYRFCWLRDAFFTVGALNRLNATRTMEGFLRFIMDAVPEAPEGPIQPLFPIAPGAEVEERIAAALPGFRGDGPVRIGNAAVSQRQNDGFGAIVMTATQMFWDQRLQRTGDLTMYHQLCTLGREAERAAFEPDAGLWEYRGRAAAHTHSAAMCWAALDRLGAIAQRMGLTAEAQDWERRAAALRARILEAATVPGEGWLSGVLNGDAVADASTFLLPEFGLMRATDPLFLRTVAVLERRLVRDGIVLRYDHADDFGTPEVGFLVCTFWYIDTLARIGRREEARALFERALSWRNHVGLLSEDVHPATGALWGNFPQTYSQVGLILSAMRLSRSWEEGLWRAS
ncbi:glycoside hydrolase family 15 protein [Roseomonas eburnea]|uniref:Glycoside hydrolase family 15 protein n=1 Tax=Neoroseomonas eburnea TaxID=1346889 RepID=A0A9X9XIF7_9PROT|nr:glycoside hydrolase family 15 protein [Neoroseomonas eburnea]MBR0683493.1 glycoside hydrolase family 15 protein [Neoroseomonas eburnea]